MRGPSAPVPVSPTRGPRRGGRRCWRSSRCCRHRGCCWGAAIAPGAGLAGGGRPPAADRLLAGRRVLPGQGPAADGPCADPAGSLAAAGTVVLAHPGAFSARDLVGRPGCLDRLHGGARALVVGGRVTSGLEPGWPLVLIGAALAALGAGASHLMARTWRSSE